MQTLVLLLAPSADVYMAIPALRAYKRQAGDGQVHILTKESHVQLLSQLDEVTVHGFAVESIVNAIAQNDDHKKALGLLDELLMPLKERQFDRVYNLSFSALSSYLTDVLAPEGSEVRGYARHSDGTLRIPDDTSAYVFAQILENSPNRYHKTQIYAATLGVELSLQDLTGTRSSQSRRLVINLETSSNAYPAELWAMAISGIQKNDSLEIIISGSPDQSEMAKAIAPNLRFVSNIDLNLSEVDLLVSGPSRLSGRGSLEGLPVLLLCDRTLNFWENGPWSAGSRVFAVDQLQAISPDLLASEILRMLKNQEPIGACWLRSVEEQTYKPHQIEDDLFGWDLLQALYTAGSYPRARTQTESLGFQRIFEISELALQSIATWSQSKKRSAENLHMVDEILLQIAQFCPAVGPIIRWFNTERIRLGPASEEELLQANQKLFSDLFWISSVYREYADESSSRRDAAELCQKCAGSFREFDTGQVAPDFQRLLGVFHELARFSSKIGDQEWSGVLRTLTDGFDRRDFIEVADQLEHVLGPQMNA